MRFSLGSELVYEVTERATMILNIEAQRVPNQRIVSETLTVSPHFDHETHEVPETLNRYRRMVFNAGTYTIRYEAEVEVTPQMEQPVGIEQIPVEDLPLEVINHLFPSRYCQSDKLARFAWRTFGNMGGYDKVNAICNWIFDNVDYLAGSSDGSTSAYDTFTLRAGVCRDFAHLGITFCRALGIPARFVSAYGYKLEPQDFHAVFEAYLGGRWYLFDATRLSPADGIVRIGVGRDAADTSFSTFYGQVIGLPKTVWVNAIEAPADGPWTTDAVSMSQR
jgi:transglutaminase-like putative cysteine protease